MFRRLLPRYFSSFCEFAYRTLSRTRFHWIIEVVLLVFSLFLLLYFVVPGSKGVHQRVKKMEPVLVQLVNSPLGFVNVVGQSRTFTMERSIKEFYLNFGRENRFVDFAAKFQLRALRTRERLTKFTMEHEIRKNKAGNVYRPTISIALMACGRRRQEEAIVMLKSALIFCQDCHLHAHVFYDTEVSIGLDLLDLKWTAAALGWDFTFTLHPEWFPTNTEVEWRKMWKPCATQRLFFPSLLPGVDSVVFLDTDIVIVSSLRALWSNFPRYMATEKLAGMAPNTEFPAKGHYTETSKIPYYGYGGLNAGVMMMNLTRMRLFGIEARSMAAYTVYSDKIVLADQDIYNIIFHTYPEKLHLLDCTYNFNWIHCGEGPKQHCQYHREQNNSCFCQSTLTQGVKIVHGNMGTFSPVWPFLYQLHQAFREADLLKDDPLEILQQLRRDFDNLRRKPACFALTSDALYKNGIEYLKGQGASSRWVQS